MLPNYASIYRIALLRQQELIADAERARLLNQARGDLPQAASERPSLAQRLAALVGTSFRRAAAGRRVLPRLGVRLRHEL